MSTLVPTAQKGRGLPQPGARIRARDCVPRIKTLRQAEANDAHALHQIVHVPTLAITRLHSFGRHLSPRHQAAKLAVEPTDRCAQTV